MFNMSIFCKRTTGGKALQLAESTVTIDAKSVEVNGRKHHVFQDLLTAWKSKRWRWRSLEPVIRNSQRICGSGFFQEWETSLNQGSRARIIQQTCWCSFPSVSKPIFAEKYVVDFQDLQDPHTLAFGIPILHCLKPQSWRFFSSSQIVDEVFGLCKTVFHAFLKYVFPAYVFIDFFRTVEQRGK